MKPDDPRLIRIERSLAWAQIANVTATPSNSRIRNLFNLLHLRSQDLACPSFSDLEHTRSCDTCRNYYPSVTLRPTPWRTLFG